ncbi:flagellar filament capping protein FliD [Salinicola rhizosphaerae]|uniref:Flagellar hook-associated protein 2 n=1 Tax=Salinicola rhizosphaerae TaxID=1443141 RepID=A0ABQ3DQ69_9GAMM|nr:flagellar filament capping protein FliD [Salinicola rhizosphaerae]GHB10307.1 flagellar hook-associated protein 2 [Salinicola rhizosphaerae]
MSTISSLGIGSGLDLSGLLDDLEDAENEKLTPITEQQTSYKTKLSAFGTLESTLSSLRDSLEALSDPDTFTAVTSSITGSAVTVSSSGEAVAGRYQVAVSQLAQAQTVASAGYDDKDATLGMSGTLTFSVGSGADASTFDVDVADGDSLSDLRDAINAQKGGVTATIVNDGTSSRLVLSSSETGTDAAMSVSSSDTSLNDAFGFSSTIGDDGKSTVTGSAMTQTVAAQNAQLTVNGIDITSQSNTVEESLQGVTLTLTDVTDDSGETLTVEKDTDSMTSAVQAFVDAYNSYVSTADSLTSYDADADTAGALLGNSTMRNIESKLRSAMSYSDSDGVYGMLSNLGIELQLDGTLEVDDDKLSSALDENSDAVSQFFAGVDGEGGFASSLDDTMGIILDDDGLLQSATDGIDSTLDSLADRYSRMQDSIDATIARYRSQFADLDSLVSQMNSTSDYLTQQFDALSAQTS